MSSSENKTARKALDTLEMTTGEALEYSVIWLHGLGASGHDFEPLVPELRLLNRPGVRFVFPHAPVRPITLNGGAAMRAWYDLTSLDFEQREDDVEGTLSSVESIVELIDQEIEKGIKSENIILAGFSQGGAIALYTGITHNLKLGGILALSTYLPLQQQALDNVSDANRNIPIFMAHGNFDETIKPVFAERSRDLLEHSGFTVEWHNYPIAHSVSVDEISDIAVWLKRQFGM